MTEEATETPKTKTFATRLKEALEHAKNVSTAVVLVLSVLMGVYNFFAPEREARTSYTTLKPVVEQSANEIRELRIRLDYAEKMMLMGCQKPVAARVPASVTEDPIEKTEPTEPKTSDMFKHFMSITSAGASVPVRLPDAPWESRSAF